MIDDVARMTNFYNSSRTDVQDLLILDGTMETTYYASFSGVGNPAYGIQESMFQVWIEAYNTLCREGK